jgi:sortase A
MTVMGVDRMTRARSFVRVLMRTTAELTVTVAILMVLFVVYHVWWTSHLATRAADDLRSGLEQSWEQDPGPGTVNPVIDVDLVPDGDDVQPPNVDVPLGDPFAMVYIPRLRSKTWATPVINGVDDASLAKGVGYYPGTAAPGEIGNFALAGHRATNGEPLRDIDQLRAGDLVIVRTREAWFTYSLDRDQIVSPQDVWVIDPVPFRNEGQLLGRRITLTTCHPRWSSEQRWVWWGSLVEVRPVDQGPPPAVGGA